MDERAELARAALRLGLTVTAAAARAGIARETLHAWMREDHTLREARDLGMGQLEEVVLREALNDPDMALRVLSVRCPKAWGKKDRIEAKHSGKVRLDAEVVNEVYAEVLRMKETGE